MQNERYIRMRPEEPVADPEVAMLQNDGFSVGEISQLQWLRQHYQNGGSDRTPVIRRLEFQKHLVMTGKQEESGIPETVVFTPSGSGYRAEFTPVGEKAILFYSEVSEQLKQSK